RREGEVMLACERVERGAQAVGYARQDERQVLQGRECNLSLRCQRVAGRTDEIAVDRGERLLLLGQRVAVAVENRDVDPRSGQPLLDLAARPFEDLQMHARKATAYPSEELADQGRADRWQRTERHTTCRLAGLAANIGL